MLKTILNMLECHHKYSMNIAVIIMSFFKPNINKYFHKHSYDIYINLTGLGLSLSFQLPGLSDKSKHFLEIK